MRLPSQHLNVGEGTCCKASPGRVSRQATGWGWRRIGSSILSREMRPRGGAATQRPDRSWVCSQGLVIMASPEERCAWPVQLH